MNPQECIAPRQSTRVVTAARRQEMAAERALMLGPKRALPTALEVAAAQWEKEREARAKEAQEEKATLPRASAEAPSFSLQQLSLRVDGIEADEEVGWKSYMPPREGKPRRRRLGGIAVGSFATRLIQRERAGGAGAVTDPRARALEEAAQRWEEQRKADNARR
ncbi:MAG: hypothetical protein ABID84_04340 [Chloroflexota bacterium]